MTDERLVEIFDKCKSKIDASIESLLKAEREKLELSNKADIQKFKNALIAIRAETISQVDEFEAMDFIEKKCNELLKNTIKTK